MINICPHRPNPHRIRREKAEPARAPEITQPSSLHATAVRMAASGHDSRVILPPSGLTGSRSVEYHPAPGRHTTGAPRGESRERWGGALSTAGAGA